MVWVLICEELGLFGAALLIAMFVLLIWRFMVIANEAMDFVRMMGVRGHGAYFHTGSFKHCGCDKYHTKYRD